MNFSTLKGAWSRNKDEVKTFVKQFCVCYGAFTLIGHEVGYITSCKGPSMLPTIHDEHDYVVVDQLTPKILPYKNGDVVISICPNDPHKTVCKRIRAVEGEWVQYGFSRLQIPKGQVWLSGDNEENSRDSRTYGPVSLGLLRGRAVFKFNWFHYSPYFQVLDADGYFSLKEERDVRRLMELRGRGEEPVGTKREQENVFAVQEEEKDEVVAKRFLDSTAVGKALGLSAANVTVGLVSQDSHK